MRTFFAFPAGNENEGPAIFIEMDDPKPTAWKVQREAARQFRQQGLDVEFTDIKFRSLSSSD